MSTSTTKILTHLQTHLHNPSLSLPHLSQLQSHLLRLNLLHHPHHLTLCNNALRSLISLSQLHPLLQLYSQMHSLNLSPNNFTFPFVLKACARLRDVKLGTLIHTHVLKSGFELNIFVKTSLVCFYAKCEVLGDARKLFDEMCERNVVVWTGMISGYLETGRYQEGVSLFRRMLEAGMMPDSFTIVRVLTACSQNGDLRTGEWIRGFVMEKGMDNNMFVETALVDLYVKCGCMDGARGVFDGMKEKDVVTWSAMIGGYAFNGLPQEALELFFQMERENLMPDCFTMVGVLSACARLGALELGDRVSRLMDMGEFLSNPVLGTALIDMYSKCGSAERAWAVFKGMKESDVIVWNAMINGLVMTGYHKVSFGLFAQMEKLGVKPEGNTFVGLLCGCTHAGLVEDGRRYFKSMCRIYGLNPRIEHYGCMIDLLARAGLLEEAHQLIKEMPMEANAVVWGSLLGGCKLHRDVHLAEHVLERLIELEPWNSGNYVQLSNIYAGNGKWDESARIRLVMKEKGIEKTPGSSWIELKGVVHEFRVGDKSHPLSERIYSKLDELGKELKAMGHMPTTREVLFDIEEEEKEHSLGHHSEKLAITFGLISTDSNETIRVVKNLRVCNDCHAAIKLISLFTHREIIVRDNNRFHCFREGSCSCNDYW
ncbi:putative pentatricopeptide repeat-containing protein At3g08820 [Asparagus officinalis]|uniref:putative pentatricopeptide repeat-containing protein At3g08820 n=1 Tax=Asparagus officinalis TaxID=4686 RepID=UPI00098E3CB9|nr:putative pentatricopeptide repeat-containing protein At3g08820 [Asparagus officinalis]